jgi:hypothetical protein
MHVEVLEGMIRGQPNEFLVKSIMYESPTLQDLSRRFKSEFEGKKPKIIYFYEMEPSFSPEKVLTPLFDLYVVIIFSQCDRIQMDSGR